MLREVMKKFDGENNTPLKVGDIVDVSGWRNRVALENQGYLSPTDAKKPTVDMWAEKPKKASAKPKEASSAQSPAKKVKRSALASRPRVFTRQA